MRAFLFIDGVDGCGKSTFAQSLIRHLNEMSIPTLALAVDDFRTPIDWAQETDEAQAYFDRYFDLDGLNSVLRELEGGAARVLLPEFQEGQATGHRSVLVPAEALIVVEGVFSQRLPHAQAWPLVYLAVDWALAEQRVLTRDRSRGRSREDVFHRLKHRYVPAQIRYHEGWTPQRRATWIVSRSAHAPDVLARSPGTETAPGLSRELSRQVDEAVRAAMS